MMMSIDTFKKKLSQGPLSSILFNIVADDGHNNRAHKKKDQLEGLVSHLCGW
jgi:hypothetical protein